jgi:hypothetical protein
MLFSWWRNACTWIYHVTWNSRIILWVHHFEGKTQILRYGGDAENARDTVEWKRLGRVKIAVMTCCCRGQFRQNCQGVNYPFKARRICFSTENNSFCAHNILEYFMFCWLCISKYARNETNLMHYYFQFIESLYFYMFRAASSTSSGGSSAYMRQLVLLVRRSRPSVGLARPGNSRLRCTTRINCRICALLPPDDGLLASPKHVEI